MTSPQIHHKLNKQKYEILLIALVLQLFIGFALVNEALMTRLIWIGDVLVVGVASLGIFHEKSKWTKIIKNVLLSVVILLPLGIPLWGEWAYFYQLVSVVYVIFFAFILLHVIKYLIRPGQINTDVLSASACGFLLLLEVFVFGVQFLYSHDPGSIAGIDDSSMSSTYVDMIYFGSVTLTTIGYGDISPASSYAKLFVAIMGWVGHFYSVFLVGILVGKMSNLMD